MTDDKIEVLLMWVTGKSPGGKGFGDKIEVPSKRLHKATFPLSPNPHSQSQIRSHMPKYSVPLKPLPLERRVEYRAADFLKFFNCLTRRLDRLGSRGKRPALSSTSLPCSPSSLQKMDRGIQTEQFQSSFLE